MAVDVIDGGLYTTVQDYPGRDGYWGVGIPPSGPMDAFAFRVANALVGNPDAYAGLEMTATGPTLLFQQDAVIALTGAQLKGTIDDREIPWWQAFNVSKGSRLALKGVQGHGFRSYLAIRGGFDVPLYLGSRSTFPLGGFGGYEGRPIRKGDCLSTFDAADEVSDGQGVPADGLRPEYVRDLEVGVIPGPHEAPDFFTAADMDMFYTTDWVVHYNSNRLGYRLIGPNPEFAREDGGEGGRHPSNIPDTAYAIGTVNFTGTMPVILTVDGPSLGGFVCPATIPTTELWKIGQASPGCKLRFKRMAVDEAVMELLELEKVLSGIRATTGRTLRPRSTPPPS